MDENENQQEPVQPQQGNDSDVPAADPPSDHETPGANPVNESAPDAAPIPAQGSNPTWTGGSNYTESAPAPVSSDPNEAPENPAPSVPADDDADTSES